MFTPRDHKIVRGKYVQRECVHVLQFKAITYREKDLYFILRDKDKGMGFNQPSVVKNELVKLVRVLLADLNFNVSKVFI